MTEKILVNDADGVRTITLNRPDRLNALDTELTHGLRDALVAADRSSDVRAVVLTGSGRAFCAGADVKEFAELTPDHADQVRARAELTAETQALPQRLKVPVIAAVHGAAVGGGAGLALASDMVIAGDDTKLGFPEISHSIVPALVMTSLQRNFGRKLAFELISTGRMLAAAELQEAGVVNAVVPTAEVLEKAMVVARRWAASPPVALQAIKSLFYRVADLPFEAAIRTGQDVNTTMRSFRS